MKRLFWLSLMVFSMMLVAAAPGLPTPDPYPGPTSYPAPATNTPAPTAAATPAAPTPGATRTPVCAPNCLPTSVELMRVETRAEPALRLFLWQVPAAALVMSVCRWSGKA